MKLFACIAAAGLALMGGAAPSAASAQPQVRERTVVTTRTVVRDDRRRSYRPRFRTVCRTRWRGGERIRVCRRVRYWR